jgi:hypothetical protein
MSPVPTPADSGTHGALLAGRNAAAHINGRLASGSWWLFVTYEPRGNAFLAHLERTYYWGPANSDFELLMLPAIGEGIGMIILWLAKKTRLPPEQLQKEFATSVGPISVRELRKRDILLPNPDEAKATALAEFVSRFLGRCVESDGK